MDEGLARLAAVVDEVLGADVAGLSHPVLLDRQRELERVRRKLDAATVANVGVIHRQGACGYDGSGSTSQWLQKRAHVAPGEAWKLLEASRFLPGHPEFAAAFAAGRVSLGHVVVAAGLVKEVGEEHAAAAVAALLEPAMKLHATELKHVATRIRLYLCPDGEGKPDPADAVERSLFVSETFEGNGVIKGDLSPETYAKFRTYLTAAAGKADPEDARVPAERRHDAVDELLDHGLNTMDLPVIGGERPHLGVIVHADDLQSAPPDRTGHACSGHACSGHGRSGHGRGRRRTAAPVRFDGDDALAAVYAYLDDDPDPVPPDWALDLPDPAADTDLSPLDWDAVLLDWTTTPSRGDAPPDCGPPPDAPPLDLSALDSPPPGTRQPPDHERPAHGCAVHGPWPAQGRPMGGSLMDSRLAAAAATVSGRAARMPGPGMGGVTEWGGVLPVAAVRRLACDAGINRIVVGPDDVPLSAGRRVRVVTAAQRRVVVARDGGCRFHGCDRPPAWTQVHHVVQWADGGPTDLDNLILLCHHHHHRVHDDGWHLSFDGATVTIRRPDDTILDPP